MFAAAKNLCQRDYPALDKEVIHRSLSLKTKRADMKSVGVLRLNSIKSMQSIPLLLSSKSTNSQRCNRFQIFLQGKPFDLWVRLHQPFKEATKIGFALFKLHFFFVLLQQQIQYSKNSNGIVRILHLTPFRRLRENKFQLNCRDKTKQ